MTALVLSAGGLWAAWEIGAWRVLRERFQPDLIVGASAGGWNGWAIAGGCPPDDLIRRWRTLEEASEYRWKFPSGAFRGILYSELLQRAIHDIYDSFRPKIDFALVTTDLLTLRPRIFRAHEVTAEHLVASTAIVGIFDQVRIEGRVHSDGGLLAAVPLWAAAELGATRTLVIDVWPEAPGIVVKVLVGAIRRVSRFRAIVPQGIEIWRIAPAAPLGTTRESLYWTRSNADKWIHAGATDAAAMKHSIANCFERK